MVWSAPAFQGITYTCQVSSKTVGSTALCFFSILEGLAYCTEYLEYAPLSVSSCCWALGLGLSWIPGNTLIFSPGSDTMKQYKTCIISLTAHCNSQFVAWHKEFVLHALNMTWEDKGSQMYMDLSVLLTQSSSWNELFWEIFWGNKLIQSRPLGEITPHYQGEQWIFSLGWIFSLHDKTFPVLYCIQAEVLSLSLELSWQEVGCTEEENRIAKGCPRNKEKDLRVRDKLTMALESFCSTDFTNFFLPQNFAGVGDGKEVLQTERDSSHIIFWYHIYISFWWFCSEEISCGIYICSFLAYIFSIDRRNIVRQPTYHTSLVNELWLASLLQGNKGRCYAEYMVCNLLFLPWHFSSASLLWKRNPIATAWFFSCFSDVIFLRISSYESVNKVCSWWHFAPSVTTLYALIN